MGQVRQVDPFRCCMWPLHDRLEAYVTEETCKTEIESFLKFFEGRGSPELRGAINGLTEDLRDPHVYAEFNITLIDGPKRDLPAQNTLRRIEETGMMMAPLGLLLFCFSAARPHRRRAKAPMKRLISTAIVLLLFSGQLPVVGGQGS